MRVGGHHYRTIWSEDGAVAVIDQTRLPFELVPKHLHTMADAAEAISTMVVRGAPLIGATAAYGVALAMAADPSDASLDDAVRTLGATRPTAVNLHWALERMDNGLRGRTRMSGEPLRSPRRGGSPRRMSNAAGPSASTGPPSSARSRERKAGPVNILTHCNAGWLASIDWGTALAPIYVAHEAGFRCMSGSTRRALATRARR